MKSLWVSVHELHGLHSLQRDCRRCSTWLGSGRVSARVKVGDKSSSHRDRSGVAEGKIVKTEH